MGISNGIGQISKDTDHLLRPANMPFSVFLKQPTSRCKLPFMLDAVKNIQHLALCRRGIANAVCGKDRKVHLAGKLHRRSIAGFLGPVKMPLEFDINVSLSEG